MKKPHVLVGTTSDTKYLSDIKKLGWGRIWTRNKDNTYAKCFPFEGERWGWDNGAFVDHAQNRDFDEAQFFKNLERFLNYETPCMAVCPDIVEGGNESLDLSVQMLSKLPLHWPWYLAVQDRMNLNEVSQALTEGFAGIFLGGSTLFKSRAREFVDITRSSNVGFHYGRCSTPRKLIHAIEIGADSVDTNQILWARSEWKRFRDLWVNYEQSNFGFV